AGGGSTLATQIEKYRHSPDGRTDSAAEKLRQMASATLRAYSRGEDTRPRRREIVLDYLNTVPLAARAGFGEVNGIGDGLWAWFGRDIAEMDRLLADDAQAATLPLAERALAFKQVLALFVAQRRPSYYLLDGVADLGALVDAHLRVMAGAGLIDAALRDAALAQPLRVRPQAPPREPVSFVERKASTATRTR
ncbi:MAG: transglycosylase domain-containing protein, partial [Thauera sp.]|nr:transglycosylase domain-containing protein [Thauera sp.]